MSIGSLGFHARCEYKYLLTDFHAEELRRVLAYHMELDKYCALATEKKYLNTSLYFDSHNYHCYHSAATGEKNRFKLRARWYTGQIGEPLFLEEKRRTTDVIAKSRVRIRPEALEETRPTANRSNALV